MSPESRRVRFAPLRTSRPARDIKSGRGIALRKRPAICERTARRRRKSVGVLITPNPPIAGCLLFWLVVPKADRPKATPFRSSQGNPVTEAMAQRGPTEPGMPRGPWGNDATVKLYLGMQRVCSVPVVTRCRLTRIGLLIPGPHTTRSGQ